MKKDIQYRTGMDVPESKDECRKLDCRCCAYGFSVSDCPDYGD